MVMSSQDERKNLEGELAALQARLTDLQSRLPAHSLPPALLAELDEIDERLLQIRQRLAALPGGSQVDQP